LTVLIAVPLVAAPLGLWYSFSMERLVTRIIDNDIAASQASEALELALVNQKGYVTYFFLDGNPEWLTKLEHYREVFQERLNEVRAHAVLYEELELIEQIEAEYRKYIDLKDQVIRLYQSGDREQGRQIHQETRALFFNILNLCEQHRQLHRELIAKAREENQAKARGLRLLALMAALVALAFGLLLTMVLGEKVFGPLQRLAQEVGWTGAGEAAGNEVLAIKRGFEGLKENFDQTQAELEKSREHLLQAEKLALVGKLAAGMAHSIRNPFTSVKMRLFSLGRSLHLAEDQREDFEVISEEIRHIDNIVRNFLEFSRPPKLIMQPISPSTVVDSVIQLLTHRLKAYEVSVRVERREVLPPIAADPEQLKEVLVNLIENACEAMSRGGVIRISEEAAPNEKPPYLVLRLKDDGSGIEPDALDKIFMPFFTTKADGTGLGLSIAARIIAEHGGRIEAHCPPEGGTVFEIRLPLGAERL
jgi:signal transduction histidine kinase